MKSDIHVCGIASLLPSDNELKQLKLLQAYCASNLNYVNAHMTMGRSIFDAANENFRFDWLVWNRLIRPLTPLWHSTDASENNGNNSAHVF